MLEAAFVGLVAASSLVVGALAAFTGRIGERSLGLVMAFGSGVLMSAVAYELVAEALHDEPWILVYALAFALGSLVFYIGSILIDRANGADGRGGRPSRTDPGVEGRAIVLGTVLDGIPESVVLGVSLIGGGAVSPPMLLAVVISNVPESLGASADLEAAGMSRRRIVLLWSRVVVASALAAAVGYAVLSAAPQRAISAVQMFAGGAIIAMLAESMVPEASEKGGRAVGLATALGFAAAAILSAAT